MAPCRPDINGVVSMLNANSPRRNQDIHCFLLHKSQGLSNGTDYVSVRLPQRCVDGSGLLRYYVVPEVILHIPTFSTKSTFFFKVWYTQSSQNRRGIIFSKSRTGSEVTYRCHHNSKRHPRSYAPLRSI